MIELIYFFGNLCSNKATTIWGIKTLLHLVFTITNIINFLYLLLIEVKSISGCWEILSDSCIPFGDLLIIELSKFLYQLLSWNITFFNEPSGMIFDWWIRVAEKVKVLMKLQTLSQYLFDIFQFIFIFFPKICVFFQKIVNKGYSQELILDFFELAQSLVWLR